jgi:hypothetical protein
MALTTRLPCLGTSECTTPKYRKMMLYFVKCLHSVSRVNIVEGVDVWGRQIQYSPQGDLCLSYVDCVAFIIYEWSIIYRSELWCMSG